jgi:tetratricopeptide (TPR) repeat protein
LAASGARGSSVGALSALVFVVVACDSEPRNGNDRHVVAIAATHVPQGETRPLSQSERRTTAGAIALANLDGEIASLERHVAAVPHDVGAAASLVDALGTRALCRGRLADHARAAEMAEQVVRLAPREARSYLLRARARASYHRFDDALADLREAEGRGAPAEAVAYLRASILREIGERDDALNEVARQAEGRASIFSLGTAAALYADRGEFEKAEEMFGRALREYPDVSPFPVAWLYLQQGSMLEKRGRIDGAREFYMAALDRLPAFVPALSKLADLEAANGNVERAIEHLRAALLVSDDPDHLSRLAALLRRQGREAEAAPLREEAQRRFEALVAEHPEAFAAHAAEFWLDVGGDAQKGLELARLNWKVRRRPEDRALLARAEEAARSADAKLR